MPNKRLFIVFGTKTRHKIDFNDWETLLDLVKDVVTPDVVNAIHCELPVRPFPPTKFWFCRSWVAEDNRAHRANQENVEKGLLDYYFPKMGKIAAEIRDVTDGHLLNSGKVFNNGF